MKIFALLLFQIYLVYGEISLPDDWRDARDPLEMPHYREIVLTKYPEYSKVANDGIIRHITNGNIAIAGQFNHHVLMYMYIWGSSYICGASLIKYNWIITAAHCAYQFTSFDLYFGVVDRTVGAQHMETVNDLINVKIHQNYNDDTLENDIALIFMSSATEVLLSYTNVAIIDLPVLIEDLTSKNATVCGFGRTSDSSSSSSSVLRYITRPIITNEVCSVNFVIFDSNLCIDTSNGVSTCSGDSGGGLTVVDETNETVLVGIVSFGANLGCTLGYPAGFTRVTSFLSWISFTFNETYYSTTTTTTSTVIPTNTTTTTQASTTQASTTQATTTQATTTTTGTQDGIKISVNLALLILIQIVLLAWK